MATSWWLSAVAIGQGLGRKVKQGRGNGRERKEKGRREGVGRRWPLAGRVACRRWKSKRQGGGRLGQWE